MDFGVSTMGLVLVLVTGAQNCALCICSVSDGHLSHVPSQSSQPGSEAMARIFTLRPGQEEGHRPPHTHTFVRTPRGTSASSRSPRRKPRGAQIGAPRSTAQPRLSDRAKPWLIGLKHKHVQIYSRYRYVGLCVLNISRQDPGRKPGRSEDVDAQDQGFAGQDFFFS